MSAAHRHYLFLSSSARSDGNTEKLAREAAKSLPKDVAQTWLHLSDHPLPPFKDIRHSGDGVYPKPEGNGQFLLDATMAATDIVFVAPVYWYSLPADAKLYLDHWSAWMRVPGIEFKTQMAAKTLWAVTMLSDLDQTQAEPLIDSLEWTAKYLNMRWGGSLLGYANRPGDIMDDATALARAKAFFVE